MLEAHIAAKRLPSGTALLHEVAFAAAAGETVALLGASGAGKTTMLRILLGLDRRFQGSVRLAAARVGAMFQEPRLLPWCTVGANIRLAVPRGRPAPDVAALLHAVALPGAAGLYPRQISLGMARRVAFARALAIDPDLLVLDEPFASLDPGSAGVVAAGLAHAARTRGAAVVFATHDIDRALALATRIVVLAGRPATVAHRTELAAGDAQRTRADLIARFPFLSTPTTSPAHCPHPAP